MIDNEDVEDVFESTLFDNESYELRNFTVGQQQLKLLCSGAASTDYDLTGQTIWPAAQMLADYLAAHQEILNSCTYACELGAGLGLVGLLAAQACPVILTDHNEVVMRVLMKNAALNPSSHGIRCVRMDWGSQEDIATLLAQSPEAQGYDVVLGADVCYSLKALPVLLGAAAQLLSHKAGSKFLLGYVSRAYSIDKQLLVVAEHAGFRIEELLDQWQQLPGSLQGMVYALTFVA